MRESPGVDAFLAGTAEARMLANGLLTQIRGICIFDFMVQESMLGRIYLSFPI